MREAHRERLREKALSYPRDRSFKFQLNRENYAYISEWRDTENVYGDAAGKFIKAVIEEYARKPMVEREGVLYRELIDFVQNCMETRKALVITLRSGDRYEVKPFSVCTDRGCNYHYLAGYARPSGAPEAPDRPASFRLTNLIAYRKSGRSGRLTDEQKKDMARKIQASGVQFLLQDAETVMVRLTKQGKSMYDSQAHLRPAFDDRRENGDGSWLYRFSCTPIQAQFYFFKFGAEAEIVSPPALRQRFMEQYEQALSVYQT